MDLEENSTGENLYFSVTRQTSVKSGKKEEKERLFFYSTELKTGRRNQKIFRNGGKGREKKRKGGKEEERKRKKKNEKEKKRKEKNEKKKKERGWEKYIAFKKLARAHDRET